MSDEERVAESVCEEPEKPATAFGVDVGTSRIVVARQVGKEIKFRSQLNAFVALPFSNLTENALAKENIPVYQR